MAFTGRPIRPPPQSVGGARDVNDAMLLIEALEARVDRLTLVCLSMWTLLKARGMSEAELSKTFQALDLEDGVADGRLKRRQVSRCEDCERPMAPRQVKCIYCGATKSMARGGDSVFDYVI